MVLDFFVVVFFVFLLVDGMLFASPLSGRMGRVRRSESVRSFVREMVFCEQLRTDYDAKRCKLVLKIVKSWNRIFVGVCRNLAQTSGFHSDKIDRGKSISYAEKKFHAQFL